jgi:hypothetical protein
MIVAIRPMKRNGAPAHLIRNDKALSGQHRLSDGAGRPGHASIIEIAMAIAFTLAAALFLVETLLARRPGWPSRSPLSLDDEGLPNDLRQPLRGRLAVL